MFAATLTSLVTWDVQLLFATYPTSDCDLRDEWRDSCSCSVDYQVDALGITLSPSQAEYAPEWIDRAGLASRCQIEIRDYRDLEPERPFDNVTNVGMFEHVGLKQLPAYFESVFRDGGRGDVQDLAPEDLGARAHFIETGESLSPIVQTPRCSL